MPSTTIEIPEVLFSGFYYPEILEDLIQYMRTRVPELSDEDPAEPAIQLLRAFSLAAHNNNVLLDHTAQERFITTARLRESVRGHLALISVQLAQAIPATADLLFELSKLFTSATTVIPAKSKFATQSTATVDAVLFEVLVALATARTDLLTNIISYDIGTTTYADETDPITPWTGIPQEGDIIYFGHTDMLWNRLDLNITTPGAGITTGVWEYYDGDYDDDEPDSVTQIAGPALEFVINDLLGAVDRHGTVVRVKCNLTGATQDLVSTWTGSENKITTTGTDPLLGQAAASTDASDYTVGSLWNELQNVVDGTSNFTGSGEVALTYDLPQTLTENWIKAAVGATGSEVTAYWIRFRVIAVSSPTSPIFQTVDPSNGQQYLLAIATQGESRSDNPLGSSSGLPSQTFQLAQYPVVDDTNLKLYITEPSEGSEVEWSRVDNFLNSTSEDKHFIVAFDDAGRVTITVGDGVSGKIPEAGTDNVRAEYRTLTEGQDGNVGAGTIVVNRAGITFINSTTNPRAATGYEDAEGSDEVTLEQAKVSGPATLRTRSRGVTAADVEFLTAAFVADDGTRPFVRALGIEEGLGPKTIEAVCVGPGGAAPSSAHLAELEEYFNGDPANNVRGVLLMNSELTATSVQGKTIDITATVTGGSQTSIEVALTALLNPAALKSDGVTYEWDFGGTVTRARIITEIMNSTPAPTNVTLSIPAADVGLDTRELPVVGTLTITVV